MRPPGDGDGSVSFSVFDMFASCTSALLYMPAGSVACRRARVLTSTRHLFHIVDQGRVLVGWENSRHTRPSSGSSGYIEDDHSHPLPVARRQVRYEHVL